MRPALYCYIPLQDLAQITKSRSPRLTSANPTIRSSEIRLDLYDFAFESSEMPASAGDDMLSEAK